jgi:hypothetical protein
MKKAILAFLATIAVAMVFIIGKSMTPDAMAVVVGIVCGIGASIPTSLVMLLLMRRRDGEAVAESPRGAAQMPTVMIVNPAAGNPAQYQQPANQFMPPYGHAMPRQFQVVGAETQDDQGYFGI